MAGLGDLEEAATEYIRRRDRLDHPTGFWDRAGRWWPHDHEECACCRGLRLPSRSYPYTLLTHCRSLRHVARLYGVPEGELRRYVSDLRAAQPEEMTDD